MINILIAMDKCEEAAILSQLINRMISAVSLYVAKTIKHASAIIDRVNIDAAFIDLELKDGEGCKLAKEIKRTSVYFLMPIIFLTTQSINILRLYEEFHCYSCVSKLSILENTSDLADIKELLLKLKKTKSQPKKDSKLFISYDNKKTVLPLADIFYAEVSGRTITLITKSGSYEPINMGLTKFINYVDHTYFIRCHRSFAVNLDNVKHIQTFEPRLYKVAFIKEVEKPCFVSQTYYSNVLNCFSNKTK